MTVYRNGLGRMTKMAAMPIYSKTRLIIFFSRNRSLMILQLRLYMENVTMIESLEIIALCDLELGLYTCKKLNDYTKVYE